MKKSVLVFIGLAAATILSGAVRTVRFTVTGWTCGSCAAATRIAVKKLDGVTEISTDAKKGEAIVIYDDTRVSPEQMAAVIRRLGYKAQVAEATADGASSGGAAALAEKPAAALQPVTFFDVPLGCPAVKNLGCGSLAAPILADLEKKPRIAEAWLDHAGTVLAVVWKGRPASAGVADVEAAFRKSSLEATQLAGPAAKKARGSFGSREKWYRGTDVLRLSKEEARVLAARLVKPVEVELGAERAASLRREFTAAFERCFLGEKPLDREDFVKIAQKYVDEKGLEKMGAALEYCGIEEESQ